MKNLLSFSFSMSPQRINVRDAVFTTVHTQEALIKLLVRKGVITEEGLLEEIKKIKNKKGLRLG